MKTIVLASDNEVKLEVVKSVASSLLPSEIFEYITIDLEKEGAEPHGREACLSQIRSALAQARSQFPTADYFIAIEGGTQDNGDVLDEAAFAIVHNNAGNEGVSSAASFPIPPEIAKNVRAGADFAKSVEAYFKTKDVKRGKGYVGILTNGLIDKEALYYQPACIAFAKVIHQEWY